VKGGGGLDRAGFKGLFSNTRILRGFICIVETRNNAHTREARLQLILFSKDIGALKI
jgi:hypothetical protein